MLEIGCQPLSVWRDIVASVQTDFFGKTITIKCTLFEASQSNQRELKMEDVTFEPVCLMSYFL